MYLHYNELKTHLVIKEEVKTLFRKQTETETSFLKEGLLFHKKILNPLLVYKEEDEFVLVCGHHRWSLLQEIVKEELHLAEGELEFDLEIPITIIEKENTPQEIIREQLGRRNLSSEDIALYANSLRQFNDSLTQKEVINQAAKDLNVPANQVKNALYTGRATQAQQYSKNYSKINHSNSIDTVPISAQKPFKSSDVVDTPDTPDTHKTEVRKKWRLRSRYLIEHLSK
ncbi:MAG: hypothetical protein HC930_11545 [Hydrococcus sp. SU_1_0]|nr:hypothetical protein [Hydrococcus sp. SU_1_0]